MSDTREVKVSRIKKLNAKGKISFVESLLELDEKKLEEHILNAIAKEFATKLLEFHKVRTKRSFGAVEYDATLEVIVPEGSYVDEK